MTVYYLVSGDDAPQIQVTLTRDSSGDAIVLTDKTAVMKFRKKGTNTVLATITDSGDASQSAAGVAIFQWGSTDLDINDGLYEAEVQITDDTSNQVETVYELIEFRVREDF